MKMSENFYETDLRQALQVELESHRIKVLGDATPFFAQIMKAYPISGSKIAWAQVPGSIERVEENRDLEMVEFIRFFDEITREFCLSGDVVYVGDSATDFALGGSLEHLREVLPTLIEVPQHHYFIGANCSWCLCF